MFDIGVEQHGEYITVQAGEDEDENEEGSQTQAAVWKASVVVPIKITK